MAVGHPSPAPTTIPGKRHHDGRTSRLNSPFSVPAAAFQRAAAGLFPRLAACYRVMRQGTSTSEGDTMGHTRHVRINLSGIILLLLASMAPGAFAKTTPEASPGASPVVSIPHYPDLAARPPGDLYFSTELLDDGAEHVLLRFSTVTENVGEGPIELGGNPLAPGQEITQHIYDQPIGGRIVEDHPLGLDLIHHPQHHHFHLDDFAIYELFHDDNGTLVSTGNGGKQSSCLLDSRRIDTSRGPEGPQYSQCELDRQGISVGWGDRYSASLPDQWVDLGTEPLADGEYVLRYSVDPLGQLQEDGRTTNNVAETRFTVESGAIAGRPEPPRCALTGPDHGPPGTTITIRCSHFPDESRALVYWGEWDPWAIGLTPLGYLDSQEGEFSFNVPGVPPGGYMISTVAWDREAGGYASATLIIGVDPAPAATPAASPVASPAPG